MVLYPYTDYSFEGFFPMYYIGNEACEYRDKTKEI